jgi:precorrin-6B methylase 1
MYRHSELKKHKVRDAGNETNEDAKVRLNLTLTGRPALFLKRLRELGLSVSYHAAVVEALTIYEERVLDLDLKRAESDKNRAVEE